MNGGNNVESINLADDVFAARRSGRLALLSGESIQTSLCSSKSERDRRTGLLDTKDNLAFNTSY